MEENCEYCGVPLNEGQIEDEEVYCSTYCATADNLGPEVDY